MDYEMSASYAKGYTDAVSEYIEHEFDLEVALHGFAIDPPDGDYQEGYRDAISSIRRYGAPVHQVGNVVFVGWQFNNGEDDDVL